MVSRIQQSLSFHESPESFISSRLQQLSTSDSAFLTNSARTQSIVQASILNRNVHIISSYELCKIVLEDNVTYDGKINTHNKATISSTDRANDEKPTFAAEPAYKQFMSAFFPGPNVLLQDGPRHKVNKERWRRKMQHVVSEEAGLESMVRQLTEKRFVEGFRTPGKSPPTSSTTIDLYDAMKSLSWDVLFGIFLGLDRRDDKAEFNRMETLQEDLLRGQFSLFPVSVRTPFWSSPKTKGLDAVKKLQKLLVKQSSQVGRPPKVRTEASSNCPFTHQAHGEHGSRAASDDSDLDDMVAHLLVFTSSIANKALASLLTAYLLNLFLWRDGVEGGSNSLAQLIRSQADETTKQKMLASILSETERLSPPVVGVMRRVQRDILLQSLQHEEDERTSSSHRISRGHDAWLYLAGASRDPEVFEDANQFVWDRYMSGDDDRPDPGFAFGGGVKTCLGRELARQICLTVARTILDSNLVLTGAVTDQGVKHWLGWEGGVPLETIATDLKQLPCQRPRRPVNVEVVWTQ